MVFPFTTTKMSAVQEIKLIFISDTYLELPFYSFMLFSILSNYSLKQDHPAILSLSGIRIAATD